MNQIRSHFGSSRTGSKRLFCVAHCSSFCTENITLCSDDLSPRLKYTATVFAQPRKCERKRAPEDIEAVSHQFPEGNEDINYSHRKVWF